MLKRRFILLVSLIMIVTFSSFGCSKLNKQVGLEDDNFIEELAEEVIEYYTELEIELTPSTTEV